MRSVTWFNIPTDNLDRATKFYAQAFGWKIQPLAKEKEAVLNYHTVFTSNSDEKFNPLEKGVINGCIVQRDMGIPHATILVQVEDLDAAIKDVIAAGGSVVMGKTEITQANGTLVLIKDTEDNYIELFQDHGTERV